MTTLYNDTDPKAAAWLRELVSGGHITKGPVNERSISDLDPDDLRYFNRVHLFAGIGGWDYALKLAGWPDDRPVWTGSCPCQPFSAAGKGKGDQDERHLWPEMFRLIRECRPGVIFGEQVASAVGHGWLDGVFADLEGEGYTCGAVVLGAHSVGAPHIRQRLYWVAQSRGGSLRDAGCGEAESQACCGQGEARERQRVRPDTAPVRDAECARGSGGVGDAELHAPEPGRTPDQPREGNGATGWRPPVELGRPGHTRQWDAYDIIPCRDGKSRRIEPGTFPLAHGVSGRVAVCRTILRAGSEVEEVHWYNRVAALRGLGNAIVPPVAAEFVRAYMESSL